MSRSKEVILITAGDPASISTEITIKAIETKKINRLNDFLNQIDINKVWGSLIENVDENKFISQFHRWLDGLKTIKFLKYYSGKYDKKNKIY